MIPFEEASHRSQIARLRKLAQAALAEYGLKVTALSAMVHLENTAFRVVSEGEQYVVRINRPFHRSEEEIRSEAIWLAALREDTELVVPEPVANRRGDLITRATAGGVPEERVCVLFHWVAGTFYRARLSPPALERVGRFTARLHQHAEGYEPPPNFTRGNVELGTEEEPGEILKQIRKGFEEGAAVIAPQDLATFTMARHHLQEAIGAIGEDRDRFGLIHADLHHANYLFHKKEVRAIDFDDCGWGHFLYDLAVTQWYLQARPDFEQLCEAQLRGYQSVRALPADHVALIPLFRAARTLLMGVYIAGRTDNPRLKARAPQFVAHCAAVLRDYLAANSPYNL